MFTPNTASSSQIIGDGMKRTGKFQPALHRGIQEGSTTGFEQKSFDNSLQKQEKSSMFKPRSYFWVGIYGFLISFFIPCSWWTIFTSVFLMYMIINSNFGKRCMVTAPRDLRGLYVLIRIKLKMRTAFMLNQPIHKHFLKIVEKFPTKQCVLEVETGRTMNFREFNEHTNKYANFFKSEGYKKDEVVGLFLENGIDFFAIWLGLSKLGIISAWVNSNIKLESLAHSIRVSNCSSIITSRVLLPTLLNTISNNLLDRNIKIYLVDSTPTETTQENSYPVLSKLIKDVREPETPAGVDFQSILCYIYTSGTTGNPKAAIIKHFRFFMMGVSAGFAFNIYETDRVYITMPMYHSAGGILGIGQVLVRGSTAVIRTKFSASNFWKDCVRFDCTVSQYIGEICRYLLAQKYCEAESKHSVRLLYGNGLRPEIWGEFVRRFRIKRIGELYGSTEGNSNILNMDNHEGSCGFIPIYEFLTNLYPIRLIKIDPETGEVVRNEDGLCVRCRPGDMGEMIGMIKANDPMFRFEGYVNSDETKKKVIRDVTKKGDTVFTSGDILYWDEFGYLYFKDRRGDTYRWHGENVSTTEVEGVVQPIMCIVDATVFGVTIPNKDGKAGMIAVALTEETDHEEFLQKISRCLSENLGSYAVPVFLRICQQVDRTGTFKLKKADLQRESYDLDKCNGDPIFYWDSAKKQYSILTPQMMNDINNGVYTRL